MPTFHLAPALHLAQAALSAYGIFNSLIAIQNLRQYEAQSEKAAKVSETAAQQLHKTRTTQASGLVAVLGSFAVSLALATSWHKFSDGIRLLASPAMLVAVLFVRGHVSNFWKDKSKVPMATGYNSAIRKTEELTIILKYLEYSWALTSLVAGLVEYN